MHSRRGIPAEIMVASCRVKMTRSLSVTFAFFAVTLPNPSSMDPMPPVFATGSRVMIVRPFFLISAMAAS